MSSEVSIDIVGKKLTRSDFKQIISAVHRAASAPPPVNLEQEAGYYVRRLKTRHAHEETYERAGGVTLTIYGGASTLAQSYNVSVRGEGFDNTIFERLIKQYYGDAAASRASGAQCEVCR
jgi:hypothetical protein